MAASKVLLAFVLVCGLLSLRAHASQDTFGKKKKLGLLGKGKGQGLLGKLGGAGVLGGDFLAAGAADASAMALGVGGIGKGLVAAPSFPPAADFTPGVCLGG